MKKGLVSYVGKVKDMPEFRMSRHDMRRLSFLSEYFKEYQWLTGTTRDKTLEQLETEYTALNDTEEQYEEVYDYDELNHINEFYK